MIVDSIKGAVDIGYRHFDCAAIYNNEKSVGKAINDMIEEKVITRDEVYITSKVRFNCTMAFCNCVMVDFQQLDLLIAKTVDHLNTNLYL